MPERGKVWNSQALSPESGRSQTRGNLPLSFIFSLFYSVTPNEITKIAKELKFHEDGLKKFFN
jgi:hypothetical protein